MSAITTHILDTSRGRPADRVPVRLEHQDPSGEWDLVGASTTDDDGRCRDLMAPDAPLPEGNYRLSFDTNNYFRSHGAESFYENISVTFVVRDTAQHYHVPLLLSPFGYTTYRGS